jgi:hypothetical protein
VGSSVLADGAPAAGGRADGAGDVADAAGAVAVRPDDPVLTPKPDLAAEVWAEIEAARLAVMPGRAKVLNPQRRANLRTRMKELRQAGLTRADLAPAGT